jgi:hypothetical protein
LNGYKTASLHASHKGRHRLSSFPRVPSNRSPIRANDSKEAIAVRHVVLSASRVAAPASNGRISHKVASCTITVLAKIGYTYTHRVVLQASNHVLHRAEKARAATQTSIACLQALIWLIRVGPSDARHLPSTNSLKPIVTHQTTGANRSPGK